MTFKRILSIFSLTALLACLALLSPIRAVSQQTPEQQKAFTAVKSGDLKEAKSLLRKNPELIKARDAFGWTLFDHAVLGDNVEMAKLLIEQGAKPRLYLAKSDKMAQMLLAKGADVNETDPNGNTPLHIAFTYEVAAFLLNNGANASARNVKGETPMHSYMYKKCLFGPRDCRQIDTRRIRLLIQHKANVNAADVRGNTPLHLAKNPEAVKALLDAGADINARNKEGLTPIMTPAPIEVYEVLLQRGAKLNRAEQERYRGEALRWEAKENLTDIFERQSTHFSQKNRYATDSCFSALGWSPPANTTYSYHCGQESIPCQARGCDKCQMVKMPPDANKESFTIYAVGNIDKDAECDIWSINALKQLVNVQDDLK